MTTNLQVSSIENVYKLVEQSRVLGGFKIVGRI